MNHFADIIWMDYSRELKGNAIEELLSRLTDLDPRNRTTIKVILGNCFEAQRIQAEQNSECYVGLYLRNDSFTHRQFYNQRHATRRRVRDSIKYLREKKLIRVIDGYLDRKEGQGKCTRIALSITSGKVLMFGESFTVKEHTAPVLVRDNKKNLCNPTKFKTFRGLQNQINGWNRSLSKHIFRIPEEIKADIYKICSILGPKEEKPRLPRDLERYFGDGDVITLQRIFNNSSIRRGGRIFTELQQVRKEARPEITIDNHKTIELDYQSHFPRMLYSKMGIENLSDLYDSANSLRTARKLAFTIAINTNSRLKAINALKWSKSGKYHRLFGAETLLSWIESEHPALVPSLYQNNGLELMYDESSLASAIIDHFISKDEAIFPIHDSFIVRAELGEELFDVMESEYEKRLGNKPVITGLAA